ncbi:MAG: Uma2 family endonuclease [Bryobacteraceae bacterium]|nr:Uma2 family endonuclease [Bryobacteraceae bacterium]
MAALPNRIAEPAQEFLTGERMSRQRFIDLWDRLPGVRFAELIDGEVFLASPLTTPHGDYHGSLSGIARAYCLSTPGCRVALTPTWYLLDSAPQPDMCLRILPEYGGQSTVEGRFGSGPPELIAEVTFSSHTIDYGRKLQLYERAGVTEYITLDILERAIRWRHLENGKYKPLKPVRGVVRSRVFPGLWLNAKAFWADDVEPLRRTLEAGLATAEHAEFVARLAAAKKKLARRGRGRP